MRGNRPEDDGTQPRILELPSCISQADPPHDRSQYHPRMPAHETQPDPSEASPVTTCDTTRWFENDVWALPPHFYHSRSVPKMNARAQDIPVPFLATNGSERTTYADECCRTAVQKCRLLSAHPPH